MLYIGIDPGTHTGFAVWDSREKRFLQVRTLPIHKALEEVVSLMGKDDITIYFEDARKRKYLPKEKTVSDYRGKLMGAGSVKRDSAIWEAFCEDRKIPFHAIPPQKGMTKLTPEFFAYISGWTERTSEHSRDAGMLVLNRG